jgi:hypothetical protein
MSWSTLKGPLPVRGWAVIAADGSLVTHPVERAGAERLMAENVGGSRRVALRRGFRVAEVEVREVTSAKSR